MKLYAISFCRYSRVWRMRWIRPTNTHFAARTNFYCVLWHNVRRHWQQISYKYTDICIHKTANELLFIQILLLDSGQWQCLYLCVCVLYTIHNELRVYYNLYYIKAYDTLRSTRRAHTPNILQQHIRLVYALHTLFISYTRTSTDNTSTRECHRRHRRHRCPIYTQHNTNTHAYKAFAHRQRKTPIPATLSIYAWWVKRWRDRCNKKKIK